MTTAADDYSDTPKTWADVFQDLDQWDAVATFAGRHAQAINTVAGFRRFCSPKIGHLIAHECGDFQIIHHVHQDGNDDIDDDDEADIWALIGAGSTAATVVLSTTGTYDQQTGFNYEWSRMVHWTEIGDVALTHPKANELLGGSTKGKTKGKGKAKKGAKKTKKPKDYDTDLFTESEDEDDDIDPEAGVGAAIALPNVLPLPGFLVAALMRAYTSDAGDLCLRAIDAIRNRATEDGQDPVASPAALKAAYVPIWLWNHATQRAAVPQGQAKGIGTSLAFSERADLWASDVHHRCLRPTTNTTIRESPPARVVVPHGVESVGAEVWTNLANALAIQATAKGAATTVVKKGFDAFPITTQQMILFASERDEAGASRATPVDTYTEILGLTNAAYVAQHLHHHLKTRLGLDVWLPSGFCSAVRMASFIATTNDRPEAFSLFSCGPQPLDKKSLTGGADDADAADDLMRMQLKVADSTTGLSDKDIKKLTLVRHVVPRDFRALAELFENMAGVTELIFGSAAPITLMLGSWVHFLTRTGGTTVANLRRLAFQDATAPSRLGWFVERRIQQYLTSCASCGHIDSVNSTLFDFQAERQHLEDGMFLPPLCPYLQAKLGPSDATRTAGGGGTPGKPGGAYPTNSVRNPSGRLFKITSRDVWQVFLDHAKEAPVPNLCCRYHLNGICNDSCFFRASHVALTGEQTTALGKWIESCRTRMPSRQSADAAKKPKLVGQSDNAYSFLPAAVPGISPDPIIDVADGLLARSAAARLHASTRDASALLLAYPRHVARAARSPTDPSLASLAPPTLTSARPPTPRLFDRSHSPLPASRTPPLSTTILTRTLSVSTPAPSAATPPRKSFVPLPRLPDGAVFPSLPRLLLSDVFHAILDATQPRTHPTAFVFDWTPAAAAHNLAVLRRHAGDLRVALAAQPFSTLSPGSEFRSAQILAPLLSRHPLWPAFAERITDGAEFPLFDISDADRLADVAASLARGNHKSARGHEAKLLEMLKDEVKRGWQLPLPKEAALELPHCEVAPLGVVSQTTLGADGTKETKLRLTHDQSFNATRGMRRSVNDRVDVDRLTPARFGRALLRFLHYTCKLRRNFPRDRLLITKVDFKSAYRRVHLKATTALKSSTCIAGMLLVALRMTFGGAPNPSQWSDISEVIADLANDLVRRDDWDPSVWSAPQQGVLRTSRAVDNDEGHVRPSDEFGKAFAMSVNDPVDDGLAKFECYLDDLFGVFRDRDVDKAEAALPLALHLVGRPVDERAPESFPRDDLLAASKFLAEAKASERKTILGWDVNTRSFKVSLPGDKRRAWVTELRRLRSLPGRRAHARELETTIGRLNHAAYVVPNSRPFLGRLYRASERAQACGSVRLSESQVDDLELWEVFLDAAAKGISINRLVFRWPTRIVRVDACPQGMGGYGLQSGIAWRLPLPPDWIGRGSLNCLEFLAALVGVWVEHQVGGPWAEDDVLLCQGDSSSATGWIARSSFGDECPLHLAIARTMARYMIDHELTHYSQWFPGKENSVADVLSRDFDLEDAAVVELITRKLSHHIPQGFRLVPLPQAIVMDVGSLLQLLPRTQLLPSKPAPSVIAAGEGSRVSFMRSGTGTTLSSPASSPRSESKSSHASQQRSGKDGREVMTTGGTTEGLRRVPESLLELALDGRRAQFVPPSTAWFRPIGLTNLAAQRTTHEEDSNPFWPRN